MKKFKVYAKYGRDRRYYLVYIFRTRAQMRYHRSRIERRFGSMGSLQNFEACATREPHMGPLCFGILMFHAKFFSAQVVAHELAHAAIYWFSGTLNGYNWEEIETVKNAEEEFCYLSGDLAGSFWRNWFPRCETWSKST